jgi:hypothetical protein
MPVLAAAQFVVPRVVCAIPDTVMETSGLCAISPVKIYTHNDSGDQPRIFAIDTLGTILKTIYIGNAGAVDYEDVTRDPAGNFYIGDFGNNLNLRTDLRIYKIANPENLSGDTAFAETITFSYPDQLLFPPAVEDRNFDCESFFWYRDSLYLFSKNRGTSSYSRIYRLPTVPGNYTATLIDSVYSGDWVTSACMNSSQSAFLLLSEKKLWIYKNFQNGDFSAVNGTLLEMDSTQKEGITFINDTAVYISDERFLGAGGNLYYLSLADWLRPDVVPENFSVQVLSNPSHGSFTLNMSGAASYFVEVFDALGREIGQETVPGNELPYTFKRATAGILYVRVTAEQGSGMTKPVMIY